MYIKDTSYNKVSYTTLVGNVCRGVLQMFANDILKARIEDWIIMAWSNFFNPELKIEDLKQNFFNRELKFRRLWIKGLLRSWRCKLQFQSLKTEYAWNLDIWWYMMIYDDVWCSIRSEGLRRHVSNSAVFTSNRLPDLSADGSYRGRWTETPQLGVYSSKGRRMQRVWVKTIQNPGTLMRTSRKLGFIMIYYLWMWRTPQILV